ncbi:MAG: type II toxin-antitoxin system RelE/ParE family toxin [Prevotellaceae bacterium]|nr:type II toxin-antitoxin system RelE/ParE family toxin [Prevotellaceae bacterium]
MLSPKVQKYFKIIPDDYLAKIYKSLALLSFDPRPFGYIKLKGTKNCYRIRVGIYRVIYSIHDNICTVIVIKIDHRKSIYA